MTKKQRNKYLQRKYGISLKEYNVKLKSQNNSCDLCKKHKKNFSRSLAVDHCHKTGKIRGLLCFYCNRRVVGRHNLESAMKLYEYMKKHEA